ncbi:DUF300-domain-containing protein [Auriculariales sp. MPI-PUGE-AT-0066]|nr:DUF300-domain-containing protein [Auriculariales sp. MPI-PUGE-AT-0066]
MAACPEKNTLAIDQSSFWNSGNLNWDAHRIGWAISGGAALITLIITIFTVLGHARNYHVPAQQRQIIRILYLPPVFAIISFFSYRYFRQYTYYELTQVVYEALTLGAFTLLLIEYVGESSSTGKAEGALVRKEKTSLPLPFCCWRYRPTKAYFMHTVKWSVMQYVVIRPAVSIAGIVCEAFGVLCDESYSYRFASVYLMAIDFASISIALYGLWLFYSLTKEELDGRRPFAKFLVIKLIVALVFYQVFMFSLLQEYGIIKETEFWTASNIADGLNALTTTIEMAIFALLMAWAYPKKEYYRPGETTSIGRPLWDSINFSDFFFEIGHALKFYWGYAHNKPGHRTKATKRPNGRTDFDTAFRLSKVEQLPGPGMVNAGPWYAGRDQTSRSMDGGETQSATAPLFPQSQNRYPPQPPLDPQLHSTIPPDYARKQPDFRPQPTYPPAQNRRSPEGVVFGQAM